jgi:hypothetical protein
MDSSEPDPRLAANPRFLSHTETGRVLDEKTTECLTGENTPYQLIIDYIYPLLNRIYRHRVIQAA